MIRRAGLVALLLCAAAASAEDSFDHGLAAYGRGEYESAVDAWRPLAEAGHARAQYYLGYMYANGKGLAMDDVEAARWYRKASAQGLDIAQFALGYMYANGRGVARDHAAALRWYVSAAEQGLLSAQTTVARMYERGRGVSRDSERAAHWYREAATQGDVDSQYALARLLGRVATDDSAESDEWYRRAAGQGHIKAQVNLALKLMEPAAHRPADYVEAAKWWTAAAEQGVVRAQVEIGLMYFNGIGVPQNDALALTWLRQAAMTGESATASYHVGLIYRLGAGRPRNLQLASWWFDRAAQSYDRRAELEMSRLGPRLELGDSKALRDVHVKNARLMDWDGDGPVTVRSPAEIRQGPPTPFGRSMQDDDVYCDFLPRINEGGNPKFRCFVMGSRGKGYYDRTGGLHPDAVGVMALEVDRRRMHVLVRERADGHRVPMTYREGFRERYLEPLEIKVKYRVLDDPDLQGQRDMMSEVAATRLLWALRYPADRMYRVKAVQCLRCPRDPFTELDHAPETEFQRFDLAAVELRYRQGEAGRPGFSEENDWSWGEDVQRFRYDSGSGGFSRRQKMQFDGLVVLMNIVQHVSSLPRQNRLVCIGHRAQNIARHWEFCPETVLVVHDLGSVFGKKQPNSLANWRRSPIWKDADTCETALELRGHHRESIRPYEIGRDGQQFILGLLDQLTDAHLRAVFESAGFERYDIVLAPPGEVPTGARKDRIIGAWISAFREKVDEVRRGRCKGSS